jgi:hypothetical protein
VHGGPPAPGALPVPDLLELAALAGAPVLLDGGAR